MAISTQVVDQRTALSIVCDFNHRSPSKRRKAIQKLCDWLRQQNGTESIANVFNASLAVPVTNLIADRSESVREHALHFLIEITTKIDWRLDIEYMTTLIPAIWSRLGCHRSRAALAECFDTEQCPDCRPGGACDGSERREPSEEVRLLMVELLTVIMARHHGDFVALCQRTEPRLCLKYLDIFRVSFGDRCPDIAAVAMQALSAGIEEYELSAKAVEAAPSAQIAGHHPFRLLFADCAEALSLALAPNCGHNRGHIRLSALRLISKIIEHHITVTGSLSPWITDDDAVWPFIARLAADEMPAIHSQTVSSALRWLSLVLDIVAERGDGAVGNVQIAKLWTLLLNDDGLRALRRSQFADDAAQKLLASTPEIVALCSEQLGHWKASQQRQGIAAVTALLECLGREFPAKSMVALLPFFESLSPALQDVADSKARCLALFGRFVAVEHFEAFLFSKISCPSTKRAYLVLAAEIFSGCDSESIVGENQLFGVVEALSAAAESPRGVEGELLRAMRSVLMRCRPQIISAQSAEDILWAVLQIHGGRFFAENDRIPCSLEAAVPRDDALCAAPTADIMDRVALSQRLGTAAAVWSRYFEPLLARIPFAAKHSDGQRRAYRLFAALSSNTGPFFAEHTESAFAVLLHCNDDAKGPFVRSALLWTLWRSLAAPDAAKFGGRWLARIVTDILLPNTAWKVGAFSLRMRLLATGALRVIFEKALMDRATIWELRRRVITALRRRTDDHDQRTKANVLSALRHVLSDLGAVKKMVLRQNRDILDDAELEQLTLALLDRFDDSSDELRAMAAAALRALVQCLDVDRHSALYAQIVDAALLHLDDENERLQLAVLDLLRAISSFEPAIFGERIRSANTLCVREETRRMVAELQTNTKSGRKKK